MDLSNCFKVTVFSHILNQSYNSCFQVWEQTGYIEIDIECVKKNNLINKYCIITAVIKIDLLENLIYEHV